MTDQAPSYRLLARSRTALIQAERVFFTLPAARSYRAFSSLLTRIWTCSVAVGPSAGGLPLGRFGASMTGIIVYTNNPCNPSVAVI